MNFSNTTSATSSEEPSLFLPIMSLEGLEPPTHQQFWDFETNGNLNSNTFICPPHNNFLGFSNSFQTSFPHSSYSHIPEFQTGYLKREDGCSGLDVGAYNSARIGLNLGHRTYFSSRDTAVIDRLFKRSRGFYHGNQVPRCQAEGCKVDLTNAKHYHRRHKVCEFHSKASKVVASGVEQRFCQQCSRFHVLAEFDEVKRSCRKRLEDHNRRRRKSHHLSRTSEKDAKANEKSPSLPLLMGKGKRDQTKQKIVFAETQKEAAAGGLSLGGVAQIERSSFSSSSSSFLEREAANVSLSPPCHEQSQQRAEELHNLLHLGQTIFEMEML